MADLSFLAAHVLAALFLLLKRDHLETSELCIGLAVLLPSLLAQAALLLPRLTGSRRFYETNRAQTIAAWIVAFAFVLISGFVIQQLSSRELIAEGWQLALGLAGAVGIYGIYAAWFVQSRSLVSERKASMLRNLLTQPDFDVFLCHNTEDKEEVKSVAVSLMEEGIRPWLDEWELRPGLPWRPELERQIEQVHSAAVFAGHRGIGPWQDEEISGLLAEFARRKVPVIPVVLPNAPIEPDLPLFLKQRTWVDFRRASPNPLDQLIFGIRGRQKTNQPC